MDEIVRLLRSNTVFGSLNDLELREFARLANPHSYQKGEFLCQYGDSWPYFFITAEGIIDGRMDSSEGRSLQVLSFYPGEIFWGLTFFVDSMTMPVTLEARETCRIFVWNYSNAQPFLTRHGVVLWEITRLMAQRMLHASEILEGLAFRPVAQRLARLLLEKYPHQHQTNERNLTLDEMAAMIGSTREMVCRILYRFAAQGAIEINRTEFIFKDRQLLEDY